MKLYYVEITGRSNCIYKSIAGKELHHEIVAANNKRMAKETAIINLLADVDTIWKCALVRCNIKVECEDWTSAKFEIRDGDYYHTAEFLRK